jgi:hypothetical protein
MTSHDPSPEQTAKNSLDDRATPDAPAHSERSAPPGTGPSIDEGTTTVESSGHDCAGSGGREPGSGTGPTTPRTFREYHEPHQ